MLAGACGSEDVVFVLFEADMFGTELMQTCSRAAGLAEMS